MTKNREMFSWPEFIYTKDDQYKFEISTYRKEDETFTLELKWADKKAHENDSASSHHIADFLNVLCNQLDSEGYRTLPISTKDGSEVIGLSASAQNQTELRDMMRTVSAKIKSFLVGSKGASNEAEALQFTNASSQTATLSRNRITKFLAKRGSTNRITDHQTAANQGLQKAIKHFLDEKISSLSPEQRHEMADQLTTLVRNYIRNDGPSRN